MRLHSELPVSITLYPGGIVKVNDVYDWCSEHIGEYKVDWEVFASLNTVTNIIWCAFKEEKSATLFALRWA